MSTVLQIKQQMASYLGRTAVGDLNPSALTPAGVNIDLGLYGINEARRNIERAVDFWLAQDRGSLSIASTGTLQSAVTGLTSGATVKRITAVRVPITGGFLPVEFMTEMEFDDRNRRAVGRQVYSAAATPTTAGIAFDSPIAYQLGQKIFLEPAAQFTYPITCQVSVFTFMPDYTADADHDFFCDVAPDYLLWQGVLEINKLFRRFVIKNEGSVDEASVEGFAARALQALLKWNEDIAKSTSTPPAPPAQ